MIFLLFYQLRKQDMTMEQLKEYNGKGPDGRVLVAVNGKIFDVTKGNSLL
jgi:membrane-associated progesterone receptor component